MVGVIDDFFECEVDVMVVWVMLGVFGGVLLVLFVV